MKSLKSRQPVDYPRKRASFACNFCRRRKRKCDGQKPTCSLCTDAGAQCAYQESGRMQDIPAEILLRLTHLESLIEQQKDAITELSARVALIHLGRSTAVCSSQPKYDSDSSPQYAFEKTCFNLFPPENPNNHYYTCSIPILHDTPTGSFFTLDRIKNLIGDYPQDFFKQVEIKRPFNSVQAAGIPQAFEQIDKTKLHPQVTKPLIAEFLNHIHPYFPILEPQLLHLIFETFSTHTMVNSVQTSLCLIILALGKAAANPQRISNIEAEKDLSGMDYFASAYHYLRGSLITPFTGNHLLPLALFYGSLYMRQIGRPIQAWQMIHEASCSVDIMISQLRGISTHDEQASLCRTAWGCFILECDDLAEFHFHPSSIEVVVDRLPFPLISEDSRNGHLVFLAMCSIRRLLKRVYSVLYTRSNPENFYSSPPPQRVSATPGANPAPQKYSITSFKAISEELDRQLKDWFKSLPSSIRPTLGNTISADHTFDTYILAQYYATKHIICRPSLIFATHTQGSTVLPEFIFANCKKCVDSCRRFVWVSSLLMRQRTHSNWHRMQALLAAIFTLSIAKTTPVLNALVPDFDDLVKEAIQCMEPWAQHCEIADTVITIVKTIRQKVRVLVRGA